MPITRDQALVAAGLLALAMDAAAAAAVPPGGTIAQGAAAQAASAKAAGPTGGGHGPPKKVATPKGAVKFHTGIGSLIIPHGKVHFVKGQPSHMIHSTSEPDWLAHQWKKEEGKKPGEASEAEKAVEGGTHHWAQAGEHSYAVHNGLETHVPKDTDVHDEAALKHAPKVIVKPGEPGEHVVLHPDHAGVPAVHDAAAHQALETGYKKLPPEPSKKAVTLGGKHAAWVPHDWQVHKAAKSDHVKFAKDPEGHWHQVTTGGLEKIPAGQQSDYLDDQVSKGHVVPEDHHPGPEPEHVAPSQAKPGHEPAKADVGGVAVTKEEIHSAIQHLNEDQSTAVKQPLQKKGHPLAAMDYHGVSAQELKAHPELVIPKGTKKAHVGQVKVAVLHHLAAKAAQLAQDEAQEKAADEAKAATEAAATHAQQLSPGTVDIGGVTATKEHIADAIKHLNASGSTAIKQILKAKGNPLAAADYWSVIHDHQAAHPVELEHGTKQAHVPKAKTAFLAALQSHLDALEPSDEQTGHNAAADLHEAVTAGGVKDGWQSSADGAVAKALSMAHQYGHAAYAYLGAEPGVWLVKSWPPETTIGKAYFTVTPEHGVTMHLSDGSEHEWGPEHVTQVAKDWAAGPEPETPAEPEPAPEPEPEPEPAPVWDTAAWKQTPEYQTIHTLIADHPNGLPEHGNKLDTNQQLATAMYIGGKLDKTEYIYPGTDGGWKLATKAQLPAGIAGTFGAPGKAYYEVSKDHEITALGNDGQPVALAPEQIEQIAQDWLTQPEPEKPPEPDVPVMISGKQVGTVPAGSKIYVSKNQLIQENASKQVKLPDGGWKTFYSNGGTSDIPSSATTGVMEKDGYVKDGTWVPYHPGQESAKPAEPETVPVTINGKVVYQAPAGTLLFYDGTDGGPSDMVYLRAPDGTWQVMFDTGDKPTGSATADDDLDAAVASGTFKPINKAAEEYAAKVAGKPASAEPAQAETAAAQLKQLLINGAVKPSSDVGGKENADWALAVILQKAAKTGTDAYVLKNYSGGWLTYTYEPSDPTAEYYHVSPDLTATHHTPGKDTPVPAEKISQIAQQMVVPDSVKINMGGKHYGDPADYKIFKHGFYYKPSKAAKVYIEISGPQQGGTKAAFVYHAPSGTKNVNATYAAKVLADATEYHEQPKGALPSSAKIAYATVFKPPSSHHLWSDVTKAPSHDHVAQFHEDGSVLITSPTGSAPLSAESAPEVALLKGGVVLDGYGTTVVKPGIVPDAYHVLGGEAKAPDQLKSALVLMESHYSDKLDIAQIVGGLVSASKKEAYSFFSAKMPQADWHGQRDAVMGLLRELLQVPQNKAGSETAAPTGEVKFLKGLPPGIATAKDVFTWTEQGYATPFSGVYTQYQSLESLGSPDLSAKIKEVGAQFGDGKVVGTHPSALSKDQKLAWLKSWQAGDMAKVFAYDASGGKVSPAHPGAPDNASTHTISWAPWDVSQVPASQQIEGDWSAEGVLPTKAEVDNYLIKAGLQHAAFLSLKQRREWVQAHQAHDQFTVDKLSKQAAEAFSSGAQPKTEPPVFTENLAPAKAWDAYLDEKTPAISWPAAALEAFTAEHQAELKPFLDQAAKQLYGYDSAENLPTDYYKTKVQQSAVQAYLDDLAAKDAAEKLKPKYTLAEPGTAQDQFGRQYQWITGTPAELAKQTAVAQLARVWGFRTPQVTQVTLEDGTAGAVAPLLDFDGTLATLNHQGISLATGRELGDIAREHVLDYALANPGSTPGSYLRMADGSIIGAGKAGALSDLGWAGTDPAAMNAVTTQPVSLIFGAIEQGWLSQDQADHAYIAAARAARRMAALSDSRLSQALAAAGLDAASIAQLTERKNALPEQVAGLWDQAYAGAGWTPPEVPSAKITRGLHSGFSEPEFLDHVAAAKSFGVPAFFNEPGLADGHVLVWTELDPKGQRLVRGEASVRSIAADKVTGWVNAHSDDASSMTPHGEVGFHAAIQSAALYIDKHNIVMKNYDYTGPETAKAMSGLADAKAQLSQRLAEAQHALTLGPSSSVYQQAAKDYGDPASVVSMAQFYLAQIETAENAKAAGIGTALSPDQFPGWEATEHSVMGGGVKITWKKAKRELGTDAGDITADTWSLGKDDGELHLQAGKFAEYPGYVWEVTLPTGEVISINDAGKTQTPKAHTGMIRFTSVTADGSASLERIRAFLQHAGLGMEEADQTGMENQYWRTMAWVLSDRADRKEPKHMKVWDEIAQGLHGKSAWEAIGPGKEAAHLGELTAQVMSKQMAPEEEAQLWRKAWAHLTSPEQIQQWVDADGYLPHLGHYDIHSPETNGGKPDWYRFDVAPEQVAAQQMLTESLYSPDKDALLVARSGGLLSSDARLRALGTYKTGMSWGSDMSHGASGMVFTRQNQQSSSHMSVWISPRVLARAQTYAFPSDHYGEIDDRRTSAFFDFAKASAMSGGGNEALILDSLSLLDDIEVIKAHTEAQRQQIVADLKGAGITEIRGLPVEDRIVTAAGVSAAVQKAIAAAQAGSWFSQPETPYVPPPSALSGAPAAEKKFVQQTVKEEKAMDAQQEAAKVVQQLEEMANQAGEAPFSAV